MDLFLALVRSSWNLYADKNDQLKLVSLMNMDDSCVFLYQLWSSEIVQAVVFVVVFLVWFGFLMRTV